MPLYLYFTGDSGFLFNWGISAFGELARRLAGGFTRRFSCPPSSWRGVGKAD